MGSGVSVDPGRRSRPRDGPQDPVGGRAGESEKSGIGRCDVGLPRKVYLRF